MSSDNPICAGNHLVRVADYGDGDVRLEIAGDDNGSGRADWFTAAVGEDIDRVLDHMLTFAQTARLSKRK